MNWRMNLADWISGGELSDKRRAVISLILENHRRMEALRKIAAMETSHANATVKRMAKTAREAGL